LNSIVQFSHAMTLLVHLSLEVIFVIVSLVPVYPFYHELLHPLLHTIAI